MDHHNFSYISKLPTIADRGAAIARRLESVKADAKYKALPEDKQAKIRADIYKKYVVPSYAGYHLPVPDKDTWVGATGRDVDHLMNGKKFSQTFGSTHTSDYWRHNAESNQDMGAGFTKQISQLKLFGARVANTAFLDAYNLLDHFTSNNQVNNPTKYAEELNKYDTTKVLKNYISANKAKVQDTDFWLQTHPRDTIIGRLDGDIGEQVATLPLYEAVSIERIGASVGIPLTAKLIKSPVGKWVASRFIEATDGFLTSLAASGGNKTEGVEGAARFAGMGAFSSGAGKVIQVAAAPLIKKWTANTIAMGGKPFAEELARSAMEESEVEASHTGEGIEQIKRAEEVKSFMQDTQQAAEARAARAKEIQDWKAKQEERAKLDPVMHKLHQGEKVSLNSIAMLLHDKPLSGLSKNQRGEVLAKRMQLISQAAQEAPVHLPELHKAEVEEKIQAFRQSSPIANGLMGELEKMGVKFADAVVENNTESIAKETGISNTNAAANKVRGVEKAAAKPLGEKITPERFVSINADSAAYMRAPRNRTQVAAAISDRSEAGLNKFIDLLKNHGNPLHFEDPAHLMLYHYGNRKQLPEGMQRTLVYRLKQVKGNEHATSADLKTSADWLHVHLLNMAKSGHLSDGNVFRSTKLSGGPMSWTVWQKQLATEADIATIKATQKSLKNQPGALKAFNSTIAGLSALRPNIQTPEEYVEYTKQINDIATRYKQAAKIANKNPFIF